MLGRVAAALIAFILCVFHWQDTIIAVGQLLGLSGFWALYIPSTLIGLSVYRIADMDNWGVWDAAAFLTIGSIAMLAMTSDPGATIYELVKGVVSFSVAAILGALALRGGRN
ncbi:hypothetical protein E3E35_07875 [Thermococcus sp. GR7]|uniref:hypothetical protein n=1 Tax=unclassified Thermococcus TaxID=2627626 RepID=UPI0014304054|nr:MULTISPECIES: hypothetical protein [unclassified Thermococcus]NJE47316.1 hypothetical protein [Thermococcus sp. GR7]NJE78681.1 hypothetical protein [Thermococcus sp. GR4]NJF23194.1 hypothetical protein [Thermococcus sp. GR5]